MCSIVAHTAVFAFGGGCGVLYLPINPDGDTIFSFFIYIAQNISICFFLAALVMWPSYDGVMGLYVVQFAVCTSNFLETERFLMWQHTPRSNVRDKTGVQPYSGVAIQ